MMRTDPPTFWKAEADLSTMTSVIQFECQMSPPGQNIPTGSRQVRLLPLTPFRSVGAVLWGLVLLFCGQNCSAEELRSLSIRLRDDSRLDVRPSRLQFHAGQPEMPLLTDGEPKSPPLPQVREIHQSRLDQRRLPIVPLRQFSLANGDRFTAELLSVNREAVRFRWPVQAPFQPAELRGREGTIPVFALERIQMLPGWQTQIWDGFEESNPSAESRDAKSGAATAVTSPASWQFETGTWVRRLIPAAEEPLSPGTDPWRVLEGEQVAELAARPLLAKRTWQPALERGQLDLWFAVSPHWQPDDKLRFSLAAASASDKPLATYELSLPNTLEPRRWHQLNWTWDRRQVRISLDQQVIRETDGDPRGVQGLIVQVQPDTTKKDRARQGTSPNDVAAVDDPRPLLWLDAVHLQAASAADRDWLFQPPPRRTRSEPLQESSTPSPRTMDCLSLTDESCLLGEIIAGDPVAVRLRGPFGERTRRWNELRAVSWRANGPVHHSIRGWIGTLELQPPAAMLEPDRLQVAWRSADRNQIQVEHPYLGSISVPLDRLSRWQPEFFGRRICLSVGAVHLGDQLRLDWSHPEPDGQGLKTAWKEPTAIQQENWRLVCELTDNSRELEQRPRGASSDSPPSPTLSARALSAPVRPLNPLIRPGQAARIWSQSRYQPFLNGRPVITPADAGQLEPVGPRRWRWTLSISPRLIREGENRLDFLMQEQPAGATSHDLQDLELHDLRLEVESAP